MKHLYLLVLITLGFSLGINAQTLEKIAENTITADTKVFTFKIINESPIVEKDVDEKVTSPTGTSQNSITNHFLAIPGVREAIYDKATATFTVTASSSTEISNNLKF